MARRYLERQIRLTLWNTLDTDSGPAEGLAAPSLEGLADVAPKDPAQYPAGTDQSEDALGFPRRQDVICQRPDLRRTDHPKNSHPNVESRKQPAQVVIAAEIPKGKAVGGKEQ